MKYWDKAWSLVEGCTPVSPACQNCWLEAMAHRFKTSIECEDGSCLELTDEDGNWMGDVILMKSRLDIPMKIKKPTVFAIWSDLFHERVPADFIIEAFERMEYCKQHTFLVLTKRPERIATVLYGQEYGQEGHFYLGAGDYIQNVWLGTTIENQEMADKRIPELLKCEPFNLFLSVEPMLSPIILPENIEGVTQVIYGGETGSNARLCNYDWVEDLKNQCIAKKIKFFFKGIGSKRNPSFRTLHGKEGNDLAWNFKGAEKS